MPCKGDECCPDVKVGDGVEYYEVHNNKWCVGEVTCAPHWHAGFWHIGVEAAGVNIFTAWWQNNRWEYEV